MANNKDLSIEILAQIDSKLSESTIQKQLNEIQKNLKVTVGFDSKQLEKVTFDMKELKDNLAKGKSAKIIDDKETNKVKELHMSIDDALRKYKQFGEVKLDKTLNPVTKEVERFNLMITKADGQVEKLQFELAKLAGIKIEGNEGNPYYLKTQKIIDDTEKIRERQLQTDQKINTELGKQNQKLDEQIQKFKIRSQTQAQEIERRYKGKFDDTALKNWMSTVNSINTTTPNAIHQMDMLGLQFRKISSEVKTSSSHALQFGEAIGTAFQKFPIWILAATAFYAPLRALQDMTAQIIEIDTALTDLNRVTDMTDGQLNNFLQESIQLSDELSNKLTDVLKIANEFARMGFEDSQLLDMTKTAQIMQNISDLDAKESVDTLTSAMLNYNIAAEDTLQISDQLNEIDNNFAISTADLAGGIRKAAATAKTFGVDLITLESHIAAIGSTTRESGNIIGKQNIAA